MEGHVSTQITSAFVNQYASNVTLLSQQKASRLRPAVRVEPVNGEIGYFDSVGAVNMVERASRHADTPFTEIPHARRRVSLRDFEASEIIDAQDRVRTLADPQSYYVQAFAAAAGRRMDDEIIAAFFATAAAGKNGDVAVAFPAGNTIPHDYVETGLSTSGSLTVAKLRRAKTDSNLLLLKCDMGAGHFRQAPTPLPGCWCTLLHATVPVAVERVHASLSCFGSQLLPAPQAAVT